MKECLVTGSLEFTTGIPDSKINQKSMVRHDNMFLHIFGFHLYYCEIVR